MRLEPADDLQKVKDWLNQVYAQVCVETEANVVSATMTLTSGSSSYTLPTGVMRIKDMFVTPVGGSQWAPLRAVTLNRMLQMRQSSGGAPVVQGSVTHYALLGLSELEVFPTPSAADVITIYYVALPTALSADADVPILQEPYATKILEYGALAEAADFNSDPSESEYRQLYEVWLGKFRAHLSRRQGNLPAQLEVRGAYWWPPHDPSTDVRYS